MTTSILGGITQDVTSKETNNILKEFSFPSTSSGARLVGTAKEKFRDDFLTFIDGDKWDIIQQGSGQNISVDGILNGARYLKISSGTISNDETIIRSRIKFNGPVKLAYSLTSSQAIANAECHIEIVEVDPDTGELVTDTNIFVSPNFNNARNGFGIVYDGISQNNAKLKVRGQGVSEWVQPTTSFGTGHRTATGTSPNFLQPVITELLMQTEIASVNVRAVDSAAVATYNLNRTSYVPNPDRMYTLQIRVKNLGVSPVSNTDWRIHFIRLLDASRVSVDFGMIGGSDAALLAPPVRTIAGSVTTATVSGTLIVQPAVPATSYVINSLATTNHALIIAGTSGITSFYASNIGSSIAYVKLYNKATIPLLATDIPDMIIPITAGVDGMPGVVNLNIGTIGFRFALGLGIAITSGIADNDITPVEAGQVKVKLSRTT